MSRSGYCDDIEDPLAYGRWRGAVNSAITGARGQALLREIIDTLDAMPEKRLVADSFGNPSGGFCVLGAVADMRGIDTGGLLYEGDDGPECDARKTADRFDVACSLVREVMFVNDNAGSWQSPLDPREEAAFRWSYMRRWAANNLIAVSVVTPRAA